jgi:hypothetical protein
MAGSPHHDVIEGAFYPVLQVGELPAANWYTTRLIRVIEAAWQRSRYNIRKLKVRGPTPRSRPESGKFLLTVRSVRRRVVFIWRATISLTHVPVNFDRPTAEPVVEGAVGELLYEDIPAPFVFGNRMSKERAV